MNAVIGTAGHVDHGKSSLIHKLTGINPSRLPQELQRGMTIDLGFANFKTEAGDSVGIIDVPGHERFIRNMVSAVWGLDLVLFVVAADEGWASLSTEHLRIITAMEKKECLLVITKCDLVTSEVQQQVEDEALEHFLDIMGVLPDTLFVSSETGEGIDILKAKIIQKIQNLPECDELDNEAHIYVDRVFSVSGIGTTITGTLRGAEIAVNDTLQLLPSNQMVRIRSLQSYHEGVEQAKPYSRVAIGLKQVNKNLVYRGSCLVKSNQNITLSQDWIVQLNPEFSQLLKKQSMVEIALGTAHTYAKCFVYANKQLARLQLTDEIPAFWGQHVLIIQHGGSQIIGAGKVAWLHLLERKMRQTLEKAITTVTVKSGDEQSKLELEIQINGYTEINPNTTMPDNAVSLGAWWILADRKTQLHNQCKTTLDTAISAMPLEDIARQIKVPVSLMEALIDEGCTQNLWQRTKAGIVNLFNLNSNQLPENLHSLYDEIVKKGFQGFEAGKSHIVGINRLLRALTEKDLIIPTENELFFDKESYETLVKKIMIHRKKGELFTVADARERIELSRKQFLPLLNRMERDGWVKRIENDREVCREYEEYEK